jgi:hypothetical protein
MTRRHSIARCGSVWLGWYAFIGWSVVCSSSILIPGRRGMLGTQAIVVTFLEPVEEVLATCR